MNLEYEHMQWRKWLEDEVRQMSGLCLSRSDMKTRQKSLTELEKEADKKREHDKLYKKWD